MRLRTARLMLREFEETDIEAVLAYHADPLYLQFYPWDTRTWDDVNGAVSRLVMWGKARPRTKYQLAVVVAGEDRLIGNCGVRLDEPDSMHGEVGCELNPKYWGRGYGTEAVRAMVTFGFRELGLERLWAECLAENLAAARLLEKVGMRVNAGAARKKWMKSRWWDMATCEIGRSEWPMHATLAFEEEEAPRAAWAIPRATAAKRTE